MPSYPRGAPRAPGGRGGPGSSPTTPSVPMPRTNGPAPPNGAAPRPGPPAGALTNRPPAGAPAPAARPGQQYKLNPQTRNAGGPTAGGAPAAPGPAQSEIPALTAAALANASPMEQKQMLGEVIYMKIAPSQPDLAGKITGMLLEMDNSELLHLLEAPEAMNAKVNEALAVLHEFAKDDEAAAN